jgi:hypothetical protein
VVAASGILSPPHPFQPQQQQQQRETSGTLSSVVSVLKGMTVDLIQCDEQS